MIRSKRSQGNRSPNRHPETPYGLSLANVNVPSLARRRPIAGVVSGVLLLGLNATCSCVYAQTPSAAATVAEVSTACDAELAGKVKAALRAAPAVNDIHIDVHCENNNVVLTGLVEDERALLDAIRVATRAAQGHRVIDAISIMKNSPH